MAVATLLLLSISMLLIFAGTMLLMPLRMAIRSRQGRISAASSVFKAMAYSELIIVGLLSALFVALGVASLRYEPLRSMCGRFCRAKLLSRSSSLPP
jgi:hypothetical protein